MLFEPLAIGTSLPSGLSAYQLNSASQHIHQLTARTIQPLLESHPEYLAVQGLLKHVKRATDQLDEALRCTRRKSPTDARQIGGLSLTQDAFAQELKENKNAIHQMHLSTLSLERRGVFQRRRTQLRRFKAMVKWHLEDPDRPEELQVTSDSDPSATSYTLPMAAVRLNRILNRRIRGFENLSYEEADAEFKNFFSSIQEDSLALVAIEVLGLSEVYEHIVRHHERLAQLYLKQMRLRAERAQKPKLQPASRALRQAMRALLTFLRFDVQSGRPAFRKTLSLIHQVIEGVRSVSLSREARRQEKPRTSSPPIEAINVTQVNQVNQVNQTSNNTPVIQSESHPARAQSMSLEISSDASLITDRQRVLKE